MGKASTLSGLVGIIGLLLALNFGGNTAAAVTCPSGMAQLSAGGSIGGASQGGTATVSFTVAAGCNIQLSLVSYKAPSATFSASTANQQVLFDSMTATLAAGAHSFSVNVPDCFFQVDFVFGSPMTTLGPAGSNNFYSAQGRLISGMNGGSTSCSAATGGTTETGGTGSTGNQIPVTVAVIPTVTTTTTTVIPAGPITWAPGFGPNGRLASVQTAPTTATNTGAVLGTQTAPVAVAGLPSTSTDDGDHNGMLLLGMASVAVGVVLLRAGRPAHAENPLD